VPANPPLGVRRGKATHVDVADPDTVGDLVRVRPVERVGAHGEHEQHADGCRKGYLRFTTHGPGTSA
jgi:hypothetical protein